MTELGRQLLRHAEPALLDAPLDVLGARFQDQEVASLLRAAFEAGEADSLRDLLQDDGLAPWVDRTLTASEESRLERELAGLLEACDGAGPDDPERLVSVPALPARYEALLAWADEHDVVEELRRPVRELWPETELSDPHLTLLEAALGEFTPPEPVPASLEDDRALQLAAQTHLRRLASTRAALGARTALWRRSPAAPLRLLSERLRALLVHHGLAELSQHRFVPAHPVQLALRTGVVSARLVTARGGAEPSQALAVRLFLSGFEQRQIEGQCAQCEGVHCPHVSALAARVLDACLDPSDRLHERLRELVEVPSWQRVLHELTEHEVKRGQPGDRVGFLLRLTPRGLQVGCALHKAMSDGRLSSGKLCAPQQLLRQAACSDLDRPVLEALVPHARALSASFVPADLTILRALSEHPSVRLEGSSSSLHISEGIVSVELLEQAGGLLPRVTLAGVPLTGIRRSRASEDDTKQPPPWVEHNASYVACESPDRRGVVFAPLTQPMRKLLQALAHFRGVFPEESFPKLAPFLGGLRSAAQVMAPKSLHGHERPTARQLLLRFTPGPDEGLELALSFRPLPLGAPYPPGKGPALVHGLEDGKAVHVRRDLAWEREEASRVMEALALVGQIRVDDFRYRIESTQEALALLSRAARLGDSVSIEWAQAQRPLSLAGTARQGDLKVELFKKGQWFTLQGGLSHGETLIAVGTLLDCARRGERFVQVEGATYLELERSLFERLYNAQLCVLSLSKGELRMADAALPYWLAELGEQSSAGDEASRRWLARLEAARSASAEADLAQLAELGVTLRDYQRAGVAWMLSCARWTQGVCLADEMGLGKTLQAGALLALRAQLGPALVVAPTSLLDNWHRELTRCAAHLKVRIHRGERRTLEALAAHDVVLVSYETLLRDREAFAPFPFATQVIDEAQVIKNARTQRAQAVAAITADFRVALSGTPIENRLGDLWSLLALIAPGLLGSWARFRARFATPIERYEDSERAAQLKALVSPFFLRRTKREVEAELPLRTEVVCSVELSPPERELYDAAVHEARRALGRRSRHDARRTVQILAELTRLRQLACHPRLVVDADVSSSKLERLLGLLDDILPRGHRALLFSQFTRHLALVREALEQRGIAHLYLDGSTPAAARSGLVERFQRGDSSLFLISLKAGGTGLNLTAADYVIHLDPWWNPAAEDQASDRAHRLGQERPVTVVKLITLDTIEEKVLTLHAHKRRLAEAVLLGKGDVDALDRKTLEALLRA